MHRYNGTQYCSTETVLLLFPFLKTNITPQTSQSGVNGAGAGPLLKSRKILCSWGSYEGQQAHIVVCARKAWVIGDPGRHRQRYLNACFGQLVVVLTSL